jgi:hypothetical protein
MTLDYSETLGALVGWIGSTVRATIRDRHGNELLVLNGVLGRAPDSAEVGPEARFFCVGHDDPREGADGFFLPAATFRHSMYDTLATEVEPESTLAVVFEGDVSLLIEHNPA